MGGATVGPRLVPIDESSRSTLLNSDDESDDRRSKYCDCELEKEKEEKKTERNHYRIKIIFLDETNKSE